MILCLKFNLFFATNSIWLGNEMSLQIIDGRTYKFSDEDLRILAEIETRPEVLKWNIEFYTDKADEMYKAFKESIERLHRKKDKIFLIAKIGDKIIGFLGIRRGDKHLAHVGNVGIVIHPNYWNRGFGTLLLKAGVEKARQEGFSRLEAETLASNKAMLRIAEKVAFKVEGIRKMRIKKNRRYEDEVLLGMIFASPKQ